MKVHVCTCVSLHGHTHIHTCTHTHTNSYSNTHSNTILDIALELRARAATNAAYSRKQESSISGHRLVDVGSEVRRPQTESGTRVTGDCDWV